MAELVLQVRIDHEKRDIDNLKNKLKEIQKDIDNTQNTINSGDKRKKTLNELERLQKNFLKISDSIEEKEQTILELERQKTNELRKQKLLKDSLDRKERQNTKANIKESQQNLPKGSLFATARNLINFAGSKIGALFGPIGAIIGAFLATKIVDTAKSAVVTGIKKITDLVKWGTNLRRTALGFDMDVNHWLAFNRAVSLTGTEINKTIRILGRLENALLKANEGDKRAVDGFRALRLSFKELTELSPDERLAKIVQRLREIKEEGGRVPAGFSNLVGGREGMTNLNRLVANEFDRKFYEQLYTGPRLSEKTQRSFEDISSAFEKLITYIKVFASNIIASNVGLQLFAKVLLNIGKNHFLDKNGPPEDFGPNIVTDLLQSKFLEKYPLEEIPDLLYRKGLVTRTPHGDEANSQLRYLQGAKNYEDLWNRMTDTQKEYFVNEYAKQNPGLWGGFNSNDLTTWTRNAHVLYNTENGNKVSLDDLTKRIEALPLGKQSEKYLEMLDLNIGPEAKELLMENNSAKITEFEKGLDRDQLVLFKRARSVLNDYTNELSKIAEEMTNEQDKEKIDRIINLVSKADTEVDKTLLKNLLSFAPIYTKLDEIYKDIMDDINSSIETNQEYKFNQHSILKYFIYSIAGKKELLNKFTEDYKNIFGVLIDFDELTIEQLNRLIKNIDELEHKTVIENGFEGKIKQKLPESFRKLRNIINTHLPQEYRDALIKTISGEFQNFNLDAGAAQQLANQFKTNYSGNDNFKKFLLQNKYVDTWNNGTPEQRQRISEQFATYENTQRTAAGHKFDNQIKDLDSKILEQQQELLKLYSYKPFSTYYPLYQPTQNGQYSKENIFNLPNYYRELARSDMELPQYRYIRASKKLREADEKEYAQSLSKLGLEPELIDSIISYDRDIRERDEKMRLDKIGTAITERRERDILRKAGFEFTPENREKLADYTSSIMQKEDEIKLNSYLKSMMDQLKGISDATSSNTLAKYITNELENAVKALGRDNLTNVEANEISRLAQLKWLKDNLRMPELENDVIHTNELARRGGFNSSVVVEKNDIGTKQLATLQKIWQINSASNKLISEIAEGVIIR